MFKGILEQELVKGCHAMLEMFVGIFDLVIEDGTIRRVMSCIMKSPVTGYPDVIKCITQILNSLFFPTCSGIFLQTWVEQIQMNPLSLTPEL
eukprot:12893035-Ditylum_brightwellii.AAC.1